LDDVGAQIAFATGFLVARLCMFARHNSNPDIGAESSESI